ncbi:MAG: hypothetical protein D6725_10195 [Planctomycetota bacterium]|nr:MAG: hypothetical protein D6725_10195 [Planctomycetota bacterium]
MLPPRRPDRGHLVRRVARNQRMNETLVVAHGSSCLFRVSFSQIPLRRLPRPCSGPRCIRMPKITDLACAALVPRTAAPRKAARRAPFPRRPLRDGRRSPATTLPGKHDISRKTSADRLTPRRWRPSRPPRYGAVPRPHIRHDPPLRSGFPPPHRTWTPRNPPSVPVSLRRARCLRPSGLPPTTDGTDPKAQHTVRPEEREDTTTSFDGSTTMTPGRGAQSATAEAASQTSLPGQPATAPAADAPGGSPAVEDLRQDVLLHRLGFALTATFEAGTMLLQRAHSLQTTGSSHLVEESERLLRELIGMLFPDDAVVGTTLKHPTDNNFCWYIDGLNASRAYHRRLPFFGVVLALTYGNRPVLGVVRLPALGEAVYAARGQGAWFQRDMQQPIRTAVSKVGDPSEALLCTSSITRWKKRGRAEVFRRLHGAFGWLRTWGDSYGHCLVATGRAEAMLDPAVERPLAVAMSCILPEAGGTWIGGSTRGTECPITGSVNRSLAATVRTLCAAPDESDT